MNNHFDDMRDDKTVEAQQKATHLSIFVLDCGWHMQGLRWRPSDQRTE